MANSKVYIITAWSCGEGYEGKWGPQETDFSIACYQAFTMKETAYVKAYQLCKKDAEEHNGTIEKHTITETGEMYYTAMYGESYGFTDYVEYSVVELDLCEEHV